MADGEPTYDEFLQRLNIQEVLIDAGYHLNRRDGLRYPSYIRTDSDGTRVRGDKFIVTANGNCCFQPPRQKLYNVISFIKTFPDKFREHRAGASPDRLVNLVCNRLLGNPTQDRPQRIVQPKRDTPPFNLSGYDIHRFDPDDRETHKRFYPYFKSRGIDIFTQKAFSGHFFLASKRRTDGVAYANLAFPLTLPKAPDKIVGLEERGRMKMDGCGSYKGKAEGSNSSEGLWIANLGEGPLQDAGGIAWFESAYDAMAFHQLHRETVKNNPGLSRKSVFVSTGGTPTHMQISGMLSATPLAAHYLCFDNDSAGRDFVEKFKTIAGAMRVPEGNIHVYPTPPRYKDWNDALLDKTCEENRGCTKEIHPQSAFHR
ncbi:MAG: toprim domain-containing protein [Porphyromonadaceae bacterium]|nr:toprim domain-containing protein [Porphyromonadaceae bacterium]